MAIKKTVSKLPVGRSVRVESGDVFIIQRDIPLSGFRSIGASLRYPFTEMASGESFEMKVSKSEIRKAVSRASAACVSFVKKNNKAAKFTVRRTGPDTLRVWRIK